MQTQPVPSVSMVIFKKFLDYCDFSLIILFDCQCLCFVSVLFDWHRMHYGFPGQERNCGHLTE